jgi:hypothetical protein
VSFGSKRCHSWGMLFPRMVLQLIPRRLKLLLNDDRLMFERVVSCLASYYQRFDECEAGFQELKQKLVYALVLTLPMESVGYVVYTDASQKGLGCVLMQDGKVVAYASR